MDPRTWGGLLVVLTASLLAGAAIVPAGTNASDTGPTTAAEADATTGSAPAADPQANGPTETDTDGVDGDPVVVPLRWVGGSENGQRIEGSAVTTVADEEVVNMTVEAIELEPNHAYTVWFTFWKEPDLCTAPPNPAERTLRCGFPDVVNAEGSMVYGDGGVADEEGELSLSFEYAAGDCWQGEEKIALSMEDEPCLPEDTSVPEYQAILRDHGPYDPDRFGDKQITTQNGGCHEGQRNHPCTDPQSTGVRHQVPFRCAPLVEGLTECLGPVV